MARKLVVEIVGDSRGLGRALREADRSLSRFRRESSQTLRGAITGGITGRSIAFASTAFLGGAGFVSAIKASVTAASDLNEQMSKTNVVFGDSATQVQAWAKTTTQAFGLSQRAALTAAGSLGALFKPLGLVGPAAAVQAEKLTQLGADLASFYNTDVADALDAIRSGIVGEAEPLRRYGILLSETRVQQEALAETHKKSAQSLTVQEKALARITLIYKDSAVAQGDFSRTAAGLANQMRVAQANIDDLKVTLGTALLPAVSRVVERFNEWMSQSRNQKQVLDTIKQAVDIISSALSTLKGALDAVNEITGSTKNTLKLLFGVLVAFKALQVASRLMKIADALGLIGTRGGRAREALRGLPGGGVVTPVPAPRPRGGIRAAIGPLIGASVAELVIQTKAYRDIQDAVNDKLGRAGFLTMNLNQQVRSAAGTFGKVFHYAVLTKDAIFGSSAEAAQLDANMGSVWVTIANAANAATGLTAALASAAGAAAVAAANVASIVGAAIAGQKAAAAAPARRGATPEQRNQWFDARTAREIDQAQDQSLAAQLVSLRKVEEEIRARIQMTKDATRRLTLGDQLRDVLRREKDVQEQMTSATQATAAAAKEQAQAAQETAAARRQAAQYRLLGLGPGGEELPPTAQWLRRRLEQVTKALAGSDALTKAARKQLEGIRALFRAYGNHIDAEVRRTVKRILDDLAGGLKEGTDSIVAKWPKPNATEAAKRILRMLGITVTPEQFKRLVGLLTQQFGGGPPPRHTPAYAGQIGDSGGDGAAGGARRGRRPGGEPIGRSARPARGDDIPRRPRFGMRVGYAAGPGGIVVASGGVLITGPVHFHGVQNVRQLENELTRRHKARPHMRRGAR